MNNFYEVSSEEYYENEAMSEDMFRPNTLKGLKYEIIKKEIKKDHPNSMKELDYIMDVIEKDPYSMTIHIIDIMTSDSIAVITDKNEFYAFVYAMRLYYNDLYVVPEAVSYIDMKRKATIKATIMNEVDKYGLQKVKYEYITGLDKDELKLALGAR